MLSNKYKISRPIKILFAAVCSFMFDRKLGCLQVKPPKMAEDFVVNLYGQCLHWFVKDTVQRKMKFER